MKIKKIFINILAVMMMVVSAFCFTACKDIVTLEVKFQAYDYQNSKMYEDGEITLTIDLYRHLAKETVDSVVKNVNNGFYNDAVVYKFKSANTNQYMIGDLKYNENGEIVQTVAPEIKGEFESNGVTGSDLEYSKGYVGIWRSYYACDEGMSISSEARNSGRATWVLPTQVSTLYQGEICIFGKMDLEDEVIQKTYETFEAIFSESERYVEYQVYYTGTYDETKADENYGLTFNITLAEDYDADEIDNLFKTDSKSQHLKIYDAHVIQVPVKLTSGLPSLKLASISVK